MNKKKTRQKQRALRKALEVADKKFLEIEEILGRLCEGEDVPAYMQFLEGQLDDIRAVLGVGDAKETS